MNRWTDTEIRQFAPGALDGYVTELVQGWDEIVKGGATTPLRLCERLAQWAHETGGFRILVEDTNWTLANCIALWPDHFQGATAAVNKGLFLACRTPEAKANLVYGRLVKATGNEAAEHGWLYRGRGLDQTTGLPAYREAGAMIGVDLAEHPDLLSNPKIALRVAIARWKTLKLDRFADRHYTRAIGNGINRGNPFHSKPPIDHAKRQEWFDRAWALFGDSPAPQPLPGMALGAFGPEVEALQTKLADLGYGVGKVDKVFGPTLARAVVAFKHDHKARSEAPVDPDEVVGPLTWAAIAAAKPIPLSPERTEATVGDLIAMGSTEAKVGKQQQRVGEVLALTAAVGGAEHSGGFAAMQQQLAWVPPAKEFLIPVIEAIRWGFKHVFWVLLLVIGVWVWQGGVQTQWARLKAHVRGFNLSR